METPSAPAHRGALLWWGLLLTASLFTSWRLPTTAQPVYDIPVEVVPPRPVEGKDVLLLPKNLPQQYIRLDWFKEEIDRKNIILSWIPSIGDISRESASSGREMLFTKDGSMMIHNLTIEDTGLYYVLIFTTGGTIRYGKEWLHVYADLSTKGLSVEAIAGISIGLLALVALIVLLVCCLFVRKRKRSRTS